MPKHIIKITDNQQDYYLDWSTVTDSPTTYGMSLVKFKQYFLDRYGKDKTDLLEKLLRNVEQHGTSVPNTSLQELVGYNRAGPNERSLSLAEIIKQYCTNAPTQECY